MLLQHECPAQADDEYVNPKVDGPDTDDPNRVRKVVHRVRHTSREEREAEQVAPASAKRSAAPGHRPRTAVC